MPRLLILAPCYNAEHCLSGFMDSMFSQNYPRDRYRIVVIADNCTDESCQRARELGADEVYERCNTRLRGKGYALDEYLQKRLRTQPFDRLLLFDIDAQIEANYFRTAASYPFESPVVLQGSTESKNPHESMFARIGNLIQVLVRLYQGGRSGLGLSPILIGSHGICIDRSALECLEWEIAPTGPDGDDLELGLRCFLKGIDVVYAPDLVVINDLPTGGNAVRRQRRRWTRSVLRLAPRYIPAILKRCLSGDVKAWDSLIGVLLLPSFSNLFLMLSATAVILGAACTANPVWRPEAIAGAILWLCDAVYLGAALWVGGATLCIQDFLAIPFYLAVRALALVESFIFLRSKEWWPTPHPGGVALSNGSKQFKAGSND